jgi:hypothetical protein
MARAISIKIKRVAVLISPFIYRPDADVRAALEEEDHPDASP